MIAGIVINGIKKVQRSNQMYNFFKGKYYCNSVSEPITGSPVSRKLYNQVQQSKAYSRFPQKVKEFELPSPSIVSSTLSSTASSRIGLVSWYLGMVKSRPIITKGVTCGLIYTAADLSSQVIFIIFAHEKWEMLLLH